MLMSDEEYDSNNGSNPFSYDSEDDDFNIINDNNNKDLGNNLIDFSINTKEIKNIINDILKDYEKANNIFEKIIGKLDEIKDIYKTNKFNDRMMKIESIKNQINLIVSNIAGIKMKTIDLNNHKPKQNK